MLKKSFFEFVMSDNYQFVPAALYGPYHGAIGIYVRYHKLKNIPVTQKAYTPQYVWFDTPDRELLMVNDSNSINPCRPLDCNFDEYYAFSPMHLSGNDLGFSWIMFNYLQHAEANIDINYCEFNYKKERPWLSMSDSGGFQLGGGGINFIDPEKVALWYKNNVDVGLALDVPPRRVLDPNIRKRAANIQATNNNIMLDIMRGSSTEMMNISHGITLPQQLKYHDIVKHQNIKRLAVGGLMGGPISNFITLYKVVNHPDFKKHYKHFHVLGTFNSKIVPGLIWMAKLHNQNGFKATFTSDASTATQMALNKHYRFHPLHSNHLKILDLQTQKKKAIDSISSIERRLPCSCPVCSVIKYIDVVNQFSGNIHMLFLTMHNLFVMQSYSKFLSHLADNSTFEEYYDNIKYQQKSYHAPETLAGLRFLNSVETKGLKQSLKDYSSYITNPKKMSHSDGLFGPIESKETKKLKSLEESLSGYEGYHKTGKKPTVQRTTLK